MNDNHQNITETEWLNSLRTLFSRPEAQLNMKVTNILDPSSNKIIEHYVKTKIQDPSHNYWVNTALAFGKGVRGDIMGACMDVASNCFTTNQRIFERGNIDRIIKNAYFHRPAGSLMDKEQQLVLSMGELHAAGGLYPDLWLKHFPSATFTGTTPLENYQSVWEKFLTRMVWGGGNCEIIFDKKPHKLDGVIRETLKQVLEQQILSHEAFLNNCANLIAEAIHLLVPGSGSSKENFAKGDRFFEEGDLEDSVFVNADQHPEALRMGLLGPNQIPIGLTKSTSLFVCAAPSAGKSQGYILPNLLSNKGSAFVIDVKGELLDKSGEWRRDHCGPVYKFDPCSDTGDTAIYNPLDIIPADRMIAPVECESIATAMLPKESGDNPFFPLTAQQITTAILTALCMSTHSKEPGFDIISRAAYTRGRSLSALSYLLSVCCILPNKNDDQSSSAANLMGIVKSLQEHGTLHKLPYLNQIADQIYGNRNTENMLMSVLQTANTAFNMFTKNIPTMKAIGGEAGYHKSNWTPTDFRKKSGISIYVTINSQQLKDYAPLLKLIVKQHISQLEKLALKEPPQESEVPSTFYFDELARLHTKESPFDEAFHITEQARGSLLRCIYIYQGIGQLIDISGEQRAQSIVSSCEASIWLTPSNLDLKWIESELGFKMNTFTGEKEETEFLHHLRGRKHRDNAIIIPKGDYIMIARKDMAWQHPVFSQRMKYKRSNNKENAA